MYDTMHKISGLFIFILLLNCACNSPYTPKPRGYYRIDFPERSYVMFQEQGFPYRFEYPAYGQVVRDSSLFDGAEANPYWINIDFPRFSGRIYLSYKAIGGYSTYKVKRGDRYVDSMAMNSFDQLVDEAYRMTFKHTSKASGITDSLFRSDNGVSGAYFRVEGNAATAHQFYVTDSVRHFLRGALYFDTAPNEDSLSVVNEFLEADMKHLIRSLRWQ
jgi:gliding motility-associated lipoprotein GldD